MPPKPDPKKVEADRLSGFLQEILREEENKYCADCESKQPRWASWNLGVFLCIRCAGLHRNLGVHISKVKSVNLDSWTAEQVQSMRVMGNAKAKAVYEAELPQMFRRPQSDQTLEAFIRAKYEARRYILRDWQPPPVSAVDLPERAGLGPAKSGVKSQLSSANALPIPKLSLKSQEMQKTSTLSAASQSSLLIDFSTPAESAPAQPSKPAAATGSDSSIFGQPQAVATAATAIGGDDLTCPATLSGGDLDDLIYGPIVSAPSVSTATAATIAPNSTISPTELLEQGNNNNNGLVLQPQPKKKSTGDILALFGSGRPTMAAENSGAGFMSSSTLQFQQPAQPTVPYGQDQAAMSFGQAQPTIPMCFGGVGVSSAASVPLTFASFGAPPTSTTSGSGGLDDLLGQFKL